MSFLRCCYYSIFMCTFLAFHMGFASANQRVDQSWRRGTVLYVDPSGKGNFSTIQAAIDSVPLNNNNWIYINIKDGVFKEQVRIPVEKPYIYLRGESRRNTVVIWDAHGSIDKCATFMSSADNIVVKSITFMNSYNIPPEKNVLSQAPAARIEGDKCAFYKCRFLGLQDTLWDVSGRHYFKNCTIEGALDFIFGAGQSIYERSTISAVAGALGGSIGFITAQGRVDASENSGFVFKDCKVIGTGQSFLGRPWRPYARVIFYNSDLSQVVHPRGWDAGYSFGQEDKLTFAEYNCSGPGANTKHRVKWERKLSQKELKQLTTMSFIDDDGWLSHLGLNMVV